MKSSAGDIGYLLHLTTDFVYIGRVLGTPLVLQASKGVSELDFGASDYLKG